MSRATAVLIHRKGLHLRLAILVMLPCGPLAAQSAPDRPVDASRRVTAQTSCREQPITSRNDEIVVCAERDAMAAQDRYRLPLPGDPVLTRVAGEIPHAALDPGNTAPCGIFEGQRRCGKAEARAYGYHGGRDPLTFARRLGTALFDADADVTEEANERP